MNLDTISEGIGRLLQKKPFDGSIKLDCGADGVIVVNGATVSRTDTPTDCTIKISETNLNKLIRGELNPMTGVMLGKLKVSGDASVALRLGQLLKN